MAKKYLRRKDFGEKDQRRLKRLMDVFTVGERGKRQSVYDYQDKATSF